MNVTHADHCLSYLRQVLLCHADTTLERVAPGMSASGPAKVPLLTGVIHQCHDWKQLKVFVEDNVETWGRFD
jgi:hypothetical protein